MERGLSMRLVSVRITNFKCIEDSTEFSIGDLTCLVGKNESGKTAILQALEKLNPVSSQKRWFDPVDFPRHRASEFQSTLQGAGPQALETFWELDEGDRASIVEKFGVDFVDDAPVLISRGYDNVTRWTIHFDESSLARHWITNAALEDWECDGFADAPSIDVLLDSLRSAEVRTRNQQALLEELETAFPTSRVINSLIKHLQQRLPRFLYFADYYKLPGRVALDDLARRQKENALRPQERMFQALLGLVGTEADEIQRIGRLEELYSKLEAISTRLSSEIFTYWSQNSHLRVDFRYDASRPDDQPPFNTGNVFSTRVQDTRHGVTLSFDERSAGFVWFFSFLVWLFYLRERFGRRLIILLDEPALSLHGRAQADLLRYFKERLAPEFQVIYTTHSPFMIDASNLSSVRVVEDGFRSDKGGDGAYTGTIVREGTLGNDPDALFPVHTALAYDAARSFQIGENVLLVDGPEHLLYVNWFSEELRKRGREALDPRWTVVPSGELNRLAALLSLSGSERENVVMLTDGHPKQCRCSTLTREHVSLMSDNTLRVCDYVENDEADIEDMLGRAFYADLVNRAYGLKGNRRIPKRRRPGAPSKTIAEMEQYFERRFGQDPAFDRYAPASFLTNLGADARNGLPGLDPALDRFERLFSELNQRLEDAPAG
jgi:predicted ATPase